MRLPPSWTMLAFLLIAGFLWLGLGSGPLSASPTNVSVGVFVTSVSDVEPGDGSFRISGYAWFVDPSGTFDPLKDIQLLARSAELSRFSTSRQDDGATYTSVRFSAVVDHAFDVRHYPFDRQMLPLRIESAATTDRILLVPDNADSRVAPFVQVPGWKIETLRLGQTSEIYDTAFGHGEGAVTFSRLTVEISIARHISPVLFEKFTGFFVALAITAIVLFVPVEEFGTRVSMTTGSIFAAVFNRYRLEDAIGYDAVFGTVDQVTLLSFSAILMVLVLSLWTHQLRKVRGHRQATQINLAIGGGIVGVHLLLIGVALATAL